MYTFVYETSNSFIITLQVISHISLSFAQALPWVHCCLTQIEWLLSQPLLSTCSLSLWWPSLIWTVFFINFLPLFCFSFSTINNWFGLASSFVSKLLLLGCFILLLHKFELLVPVWKPFGRFSCSNFYSNFILISQCFYHGRINKSSASPFLEVLFWNIWSFDWASLQYEHLAALARHSFNKENSWIFDPNSPKLSFFLSFFDIYVLHAKISDWCPSPFLCHNSTMTKFSKVWVYKFFLWHQSFISFNLTKDWCVTWLRIDYGPLVASGAS